MIVGLTRLFAVIVVMISRISSEITLPLILGKCVFECVLTYYIMQGRGELNAHIVRTYQGIAACYAAAHWAAVAGSTAAIASLLTEHSSLCCLRQCLFWHAMLQ